MKRFEGDKAEWYEERSAIMEYDGKLKREQAELKAAMIANRLFVDETKGEESK